MKLENIIFDLDGTLWDSTLSVVDVWNKVFRTYPDIKKIITLEDMASSMGLVIEDIAEKFFPDLDSDYRLNIALKCCEEECDYLRSHGGRLYEHLEEVLIELSKDYKLFIVSNCQDGYIEAFLHYHNLGKYFVDTECIGRTGKAKGENIKTILERNDLKHAIYVGDTKGDQKAARIAGVPFIYANYGFGQVEEYDYKINEIKNILDIVKEITFN